MSPHKPSGNCTDCPAHDRVERRVDRLYDWILPIVGVGWLIQIIVIAFVGSWITETVKEHYKAAPYQIGHTAKN